MKIDDSFVANEEYESMGDSSGLGKPDHCVGGGSKAYHERLTQGRGHPHAAADKIHIPSNIDIVSDINWTRLYEIHARLTIQGPSRTDTDTSDRLVFTIVEIRIIRAVVNLYLFLNGMMSSLLSYGLLFRVSACKLKKFNACGTYRVRPILGTFRF